MNGRVRFAWLALRGAVQEARDDGITTLAQALAYSLFLAIPASLLVVLGVFSIVADPSAVEEVLERASSVMPSEAVALLRDSLTRSAESTASGVVMTVLGLALALWTTTSAATTLMAGLSRAFDVDDERGFVRKRLVALSIVAALVASAVLVVGLLILGPHLERWLGSTLGAETLTAWAWWTVQWPILLSGLAVAFAVVLTIGPGVEGLSWRLVVPGAAAAVVTWLAASGGFALYAAHFGSYNKSWGTLSAVVVTLVWLWLTSASLLFGAELNAEVRRLREKAEAASPRSDGSSRTSERP